MTGAGRGLGRAVAQAMAAEGAAVVLVSRTQEELLVTAEAIRADGGQALAFPADIRDEEKVAKMVETAFNTFGGVDILVNNAGVIGPANFVDPKDENAWSRTLDINLNGTWRCTHAVVPYMARNMNPPGGKIINIVSGLGNRPYPRFCAYAVSKAGMIQMTRSLSLELAPAHIQVNAIDPGVMDTSMQKVIRSFGRERLGNEVFDRFSELWEKNMLKGPEKVAPVAVFLASKPADHLSGEIGTVDEYTRIMKEQ